MELKQWDAMRGGDEEAFAWMFNRYFKFLYNYGRKIGADDAAVQEAVHELFVELWRFRDNVSPTTSARFYLYRSLRRRLLRNGAQKSFFTSEGALIEEAFHFSELSSDENLNEAQPSDQRLYRLQKLLSDLSPRQYEALILRLQDGLSFAEIGTILCVNETTARELLQRGLTQMKQYAKYVL
ncbi:RNA polymerase sigma factor [Chryseolinea lacunae]|uniref:Sigma-70 family RNA polymerase sigma factor n=1 Tax=Chryseolinea lacunae TaxID=2801331 RepID=A0ABS1KUE6_9BACT|nr:sigma-70 family RNA polymerase sigma factor [Chryseolinea lacunae]MBL0743099.1 sigma-70 family RNA polymerase sigma factor [Chryseolinea lacunae]